MGRSFDVDVTTFADGDHFTGSAIIGEMLAGVTALKVTGYHADGPTPDSMEITAKWDAGPSEGTTTISVSGAGPAGLATVSVGIGQGAPGHRWDEQPTVIAGVDPAAAAIPPQGAVEANPAPVDDEPAPEAPAAT